MNRLATAVLLCLAALNSSADDGPVIVGSKNFTESYLLAEIMSQLLESRGFSVERQFGFGGTKVCYEALFNDAIDVYPEYTGTIVQIILNRSVGTADGDINAALAPLGLEILSPLGFNNSYVITVAGDVADDLGLDTISDLARHPELRAGFSHEFRNRQDGWPGLAVTYGLEQEDFGIEHGLAYQAIAERKIDITDAYSTDGELQRYRLTLLRDDKRYFPEYRAVPFVQVQMDQRIKAVLDSLNGRFTDERMRALNASVVVAGQTFQSVATSFLQAEGFLQAESLLDAPGERTDGMWSRLLRNTLRHLQLTVIALALGCIFGTGLALSVYRSERAAGLVLYCTGLVQTIPSIALLALMIPVLGVGLMPAIVALFLYSLLPIVRNAITALTTIDPVYRLVAEAMGLTRSQQLRQVLIPLAYPHILAGIRTAAVISIGTATLAAFIGAGGLGQPIVTGLALNDTGLILQGAIPAAMLAIVTEIAFSGLQRLLVPAHMINARTGS